MTQPAVHEDADRVAEYLDLDIRPLITADVAVGDTVPGRANRQVETQIAGIPFPVEDKFPIQKGEAHVGGGGPAEGVDRVRRGEKVCGAENRFRTVPVDAAENVIARFGLRQGVEQLVFRNQRGVFFALRNNGRSCNGEGQPQKQTEYHARQDGSFHSGISSRLFPRNRSGGFTI